MEFVYVKSSVKRRPPTAEGNHSSNKESWLGNWRLLCERGTREKNPPRRTEPRTLWKAQLNGQASGPVLKPGELEAAEDHGFIRQGPAVLYLTSSSIKKSPQAISVG